MIEIDRLSKVYGGVPVVDDVSFTIGRGDICVVVGTSGSGKTTLMRMINRLVEPTGGSVRIGGQDTRAFIGHELRRRIGYVIQGNGLFPHRSVAQNIATVPQLLHWERARIAARVDELLSLFHLDPARYRDRFPGELSGGQQQRVGVARALAAEPGILLMDEPFGALDPILRGKAQADLLAIQRRFGTTVMLVTHDMDEAMALGNKIAVMDGGRLLQYAPPAEIIARPATGFVADLIGSGDRPFRMLALDTVFNHVEPGTAAGDAIDGHASLRDAYAECLWSGRDALPVVRDGRRIGRITLATLTRLAARP
ncbi:ABC transporter ATP-binding protein [Ruixingdingia sedimenti]|uniref:ABC transporter ATP-binding protein n=1 Tax=Ruixingdingia sedimenti TaxID=3073604 RepID=A0ABU1F4M8_9RHOB|nr:ABC transporter ATP-binding protein [Xinfangfangia sp. LG-4]MDR5651826.1 ABC transporter ATP-binding protein [Xinfangfangia sp. LG-4]